MQIPERHCPITLFGPTTARTGNNWVARIPNKQNRNLFPVALRCQSSSTGRVAYTFRVNYTVQHLAKGKEKLFQEFPCLFITDATGHTQVLRLHTDRWALSDDGTRLAAGYGRYDDGSEFREGLGYLDCRVELWNTITGKRLASQRLNIAPARVGFVGDAVRIDYGGFQDMWEPPHAMRPPTDSEKLHPLPTPEIFETAFDPTDGTLTLPGNGIPIPAMLPHPFAALWHEGRLLVIGTKPVPSRDIPSLTPMPVWLDAEGGPPLAVAPNAWEDFPGISPEIVPLLWSPSATCFGIREENDMCIVRRGTGETLRRIAHPYVRSISDDGNRVILPRDNDAPYGFTLLCPDGTECPLLARGFARAAFSRAGDRLFVTDDHDRQATQGLPARCFDTETGIILWETNLPHIFYNWTGGALWSEDDSAIFIGVQRGIGAHSYGGLLALSRDGALLYQIPLGAFLPYPIPMAGTSGTVVHTDGLLFLLEV